MSFDHLLFSSFFKLDMNKYFKQNTKDPEVFQARAHDLWIMMNAFQDTNSEHLFMQTHLSKVKARY